MTTKTTFNIETNALSRFMLFGNYIGYTLLLAMMVFPVFLGMMAEEVSGTPVLVVGLISIFMLVTSLLSTNWYVRKYIQGLGYELDNNLVLVKEGVFTRQRKAIPLDMVTDIMLTQTLTMRLFKIWRVDIQTASQGAMGAEGRLMAVENPKFVRETLLAARHSAVNS